MCWFLPQMTAVARLEPGNRIQLWSPERVAEAQAIPTASLEAPCGSRARSHTQLLWW